MPVFQLKLDASGVVKSSKEASQSLNGVAQSADRASGSLNKVSSTSSGKFKGISADVTSVSKGLDSVQASAANATSKMSGLVSAAKGLAAVGAFAVVAKQIYDVTMTLNAAGSQAQETANKFNVVFANVNSTATATAKSLAANYGMTYEAAQASLSSVGDLLTGLGVSSEKALELAKQAATLGTDLASFTNYAGGATGAVQALTSAMLGETDAAKGLGLVLQDDQMKTYAAGVGKVWDKLDIAEKAQLRLNAAISQSPNAVGDFARSMDSYARLGQRVEKRFFKIKFDFLRKTLDSLPPFQ